jgi:hypothetical protein
VPATSDLSVTETKGPDIAAVIDFDDPVWVAHRRLGHLSLANIKRLLRTSTGLGITEKQINAKIKLLYPVCQTTKATVRIPRSPAGKRFENLGDLMHIDT